MHLDLKDLNSWSYAELLADDAEQTQEDLALTFNNDIAYTPINYKYKDNYTNNYIVCNYSYISISVNYYSNKKVLSAKLLNYLKSKCKINNIKCSISNKYNAIYNNYYSKLLKELIVKMNWQ